MGQVDMWDYLALASGILWSYHLSLLQFLYQSREDLI